MLSLLTSFRMRLTEYSAKRNKEEGAMLNVTSKNGKHTVTVDGYPHVFDTLREAWEYVEIIANVRRMIPKVKEVRPA